MAAIHRNDRPVPVRPTESSCTALLIFTDLLWICIENLRYWLYVIKWRLKASYLSIQPSHYLDSETWYCCHEPGIPKPCAPNTVHSMVHSFSLNVKSQFRAHEVQMRNCTFWSIASIPHNECGCIRLCPWCKTRHEKGVKVTVYQSMIGESLILGKRQYNIRIHTSIGSSKIIRKKSRHNSWYLGRCLWYAYSFWQYIQIVHWRPAEISMMSQNFKFWLLFSDMFTSYVWVCYRQQSL